MLDNLLLNALTDFPKILCTGSQSTKLEHIKK